MKLKYINIDNTDFQKKELKKLPFLSDRIKQYLLVKMDLVKQELWI